MIDLDRFKEVNDTLGHEAGDGLLREFAARLQRVVRDGDTVARLGGDEFALLLVTDTAADVATVLSRIESALDQPFSIRGLSIGVEASIGVAKHPDHGLDVETLLRRADVAMYTAKRTRAGVVVFDSSCDTAATVRLTLVSELRRAIKENELVLHYQPKATLDTGEVSSVEALVRWQHPTRGLLPPDQFIPLAQQTTLVKPLTLWVLDEAMRQCRAWEDEGLVLTVAVNLSPRTLVDERFPDDVAGLLKKWSLWPSRIELEITESAIVSDLRLAKTVLGRFAAMGILLSPRCFAHVAGGETPEEHRANPAA
jgi:diguanylate cyclase (GGDEF)-like protein